MTTRTIPSQAPAAPLESGRPGRAPDVDAEDDTEHEATEHDEEGVGEGSDEGEEEEGEEDEEQEGDGEEEEEGEDGEEEGEEEEDEEEEEEEEESEEDDDDDVVFELKIQVANESFVRVLKIRSTTNFHHFKQRVARKCGLSAEDEAAPPEGTAPSLPLRISYYDQEGDLIAIDSAKVMRRAFKHAVELKLKFLRLIVYPPGVSSGSRPVDTAGTLRVPPRPSRATPTTPMFGQATFSSSATSVLSPVLGASAVRCPTPVATTRNVSSEILMGRTSGSDIVVSSSSVGHTFDGLQQGQELLWTQLKVLGRGSFGTVYEGLTSDGILMAVKVIDMPADNGSGGEEIKGLMKEINLMRKLSHKNIVAYYGCQALPSPTGGMQLQIFLEHCPDGSLSSLRQRYDPVNGRFSVQLARHYARSVLEGLAYLHSQGIIHRDIKGDNVLITATGDAKLADFGCSRRLAGMMESQSQEKMAKTLVGTPFFMAPEMVNAESSSGYSYQADIWGLGCLTIEMFGRKPWIIEGGGNVYSLMFRIASSNETPNGVPPNCPPMLADFFRECFVRDPKQRRSAEEMLQHPWMVCLDSELEDPGWESPVCSGGGGNSLTGTLPAPM